MDPHPPRVWTNLFQFLPWLALIGCLTIMLLGHHPLEQAAGALARPTFLIGALALFYRIVARRCGGTDFQTTMARTSVVGAANIIALIAIEDALFGAGPFLRAATAWVTLTAMIVGSLVLREKMAKQSTASSGPTSDGANWILGVFYRNAANHSLWVPKRTGLGYTLNLARWEAWAILGLLAAVAVISVVLRP